MNKIADLQSQFNCHHIDVYLITKNINITYLTGFQANESWLLVTAKQVFYITDRRYELEAKKGLLKNVKVCIFEKTRFDEVIRVLQNQKSKTLGFDSRQLTHFEYLQLSSLAKDKKIKLQVCDGLVEQMRSIKTPQEIENIRQALLIHKKALVLLKRVIKPGVSEREILVNLKRFIEHEKTDFAFDPIIASGLNSCYPHARVTERQIIENELVMIDVGFQFKGYNSDLTRMMVLGRIAKLQKDYIAIVKEAQQRAIAVIKDGVAVAEVDSVVRDFFKQQNVAQYFCHSTGHGVGLEVHEAPTLSVKSKAILREGMVVTVEPAVYLPGKFGIRLEEMVLVKQKKGEVLSGNID